MIIFIADFIHVLRVILIEVYVTARHTIAAMCYVCKLKPKIGTLSLEACVEKGVPPGPLLSKLKNGEDVVLSDGTLVRSCDVKDPDCPGPVFIGRLIVLC